MSEFVAKSLCILGRQPQLGLAELESLYGAEHISPIEGAALLDIPAEEIDFKRLGGTVKTARVLVHVPHSDWKQLRNYLNSNIPKHLRDLPEGKLTLGLSVYGLKLSVPEINRSILEIKKIIKSTGRSVRVVPNKNLELSSAQVLHNKLTHKGGWELIVFANGQETILAQTLFVQDIDAYSARDQARPARDARVGMLPPKLAQIIVNLAIGQLDEEIEDKNRARILDPFCGSGVILQESLLMGYSAIGTDLDPRMSEYAIKNIRWLVEKYPRVAGHVAIETADATAYQWPRFTTIASETHLGRPLVKLPERKLLDEIISDANRLIERFLKNLSGQIRPQRSFCLAVPAWRKPSGETIHLPVIAKLTDMGYNIKKFKHVKNDDLIYFRENQTVARQLIVLEKQ